jgi:hypothetical protein
MLTAADTKLSAPIVAARSAEHPSSAQPKAEPDLQDIIDGYAQSPPRVQRIISDMLREELAKQPPEPAA